jgi:hypothetical protein
VVYREVAKAAKISPFVLVVVQKDVISFWAWVWNQTARPAPSWAAGAAARLASVVVEGLSWAGLSGWS